MDIMATFLPGDPRLIEQIVYELKSQGIFDQFRRECIADVDTKPAYQNLSQRVESSVMSFLNKQAFTEDLNKNQLREQLRKNITESGFLESGVERIVDQVVNPKINSIFLPKVEDVVYKFLGIERPNTEPPIEQPKPQEHLPQDLVVVSPESTIDNSNLTTETIKEDTNDSSINSTNTKTEDESPPFELLEENSTKSKEISAQEEKPDKSEIVPEISMESNNGNMSSVTSDDDTKMEICETSSESEDKVATVVDEKVEVNIDNDKDSAVEVKVDEESVKSVEVGADKEEKKLGDKEKKEESKKSDGKRSGDKHKSSRSARDKKDEEKSKHHKSRDHKSKSRHNSSKDKDTTSNDKVKSVKDDVDGSKKSSKDKKDILNDKDKHAKEEKSSKDKDKRDGHKRSSKDKDRRAEKSRKDKEQSDKDASCECKNREKDKHKSEKVENNKSKGREDKPKDKSIVKHKSSSRDKERDRSSSGKHKSSSYKDREDKNRSSGKSKERDKSKLSSSTKAEKRKSNSAGEKNKLSSSHKKITDDHYSLKDKKTERRSSDRDSNDGSGSKNSKNNGSVGDSHGASVKTNKDFAGEVFSSASGDSRSPGNADAAGIKLVKPKIASNIYEAMRLIKIRKRLAKLERQNQLALARIESGENSPRESLNSEKLKELQIRLERTTGEASDTLIKGRDLSMDDFEALEAKLAEEMAKFDVNIYGDDEDECADHRPRRNEAKKSPPKKIFHVTAETSLEMPETVNMSPKKLPELIVNISTSDEQRVKRKRESNSPEKSSPKRSKSPETILIQNEDSGVLLESDEQASTGLLDETELPSIPVTKVDFNENDSKEIRLGVDVEDNLMVTELYHTSPDEENFPGFPAQSRNSTLPPLLDTIEKMGREIARLRKNSRENIVKTLKEELSREAPERNPRAMLKLKLIFNELTSSNPAENLVQRNGKKLFLKVEKVKIEIPPKVLLCLKDMGFGEERYNPFKSPNNGLLPNKGRRRASKKTNGKPVSAAEGVGEEEEEAPCYYFEKSDVNERSLTVLNEKIGQLVRDVERLALHLQNNVPVPKKRAGRKRKIQGSDSGGSTSSTGDYAPESKKVKLLSENQTKPVRGSKRYSSDDLYKPRPVLSTVNRRRSARNSSGPQ